MSIILFFCLGLVFSAGIPPQCECSIKDSRCCPDWPAGGGSNCYKENWKEIWYNCLCWMNNQMAEYYIANITRSSDGAVWVAHGCMYCICDPASDLCRLTGWPDGIISYGPVRTEISICIGDRTGLCLDQAQQMAYIWGQEKCEQDCKDIQSKYHVFPSGYNVVWVPVTPTQTGLCKCHGYKADPCAARAYMKDHSPYFPYPPPLPPPVEDEK